MKKTRKGYILFLIGFLILLSCKKENEKWIKEEHLTNKNTSTIMVIHPLSSTLTELSIELEILTLIDNKSEIDYSDYTLEKSLGFYESIVIENSLTKKYTPNNEYSTVLLFEDEGVEWYENNQLSFGLRRFFEKTETNNNKKIAFATFKMDGSETVNFKTEKTNLFNNSASFYNESFAEMTINGQTESVFTTTTYKYFRQISKAMDVLINCTDCQGDQSITIFDEVWNNNSVDIDNMEYIDSIIDKAVLHEIQINSITSRSSIYYSRMAYETGGFMFNTLYEDFVLEDNEAESMRTAGVFVQNLDDVLSHNYNTHYLKLKIIDEDSVAFTSATSLIMDFLYNKKGYSIYFETP